MKLNFAFFPCFFVFNRYCYECVNKATNERKCIVCGGHRPPPIGKMIYCELCPRAYHHDCYIPPLIKVPRGKWYCHGCASKAPPPKRRGPSKKAKDKESKEKDKESKEKDKDSKDIKEKDTKESKNSSSSIIAQATTTESLTNTINSTSSTPVVTKPNESSPLR